MSSTEVTGEFIRNKIANKIVKPKPAPAVNSRNVEEIIIPPEKWEEILNELRELSYWTIQLCQSLWQKMNQSK